MGYHDLFFKEAFSISGHAANFVKHTFPPELVGKIDFTSFVLEKDSHVDTALAEHFSKTRQDAGDPRCALSWEKGLEPRNPDFQI